VVTFRPGMQGGDGRVRPSSRVPARPEAEWGGQKQSVVLGPSSATPRPDAHEEKVSINPDRVVNRRCRTSWISARVGRISAGPPEGLDTREL